MIGVGVRSIGLGVKMKGLGVEMIRECYLNISVILQGLYDRSRG